MDKAERFTVKIKVDSGFYHCTTDFLLPVLRKVEFSTLGDTFSGIFVQTSVR